MNSATELKVPAVTLEEALTELGGEEKDEKSLKWRFVARGAVLDHILAFFGARPIYEDGRTVFIVGSGEKAKELGDVAELLFAKCCETGVTLADVVALIRARRGK